MRELDEENARPERGQILSARVATLLDEEPRSLQRLSGGSKKGAYRVQLHDDSTVIAYVWDSAENYWPDGDGEREPFTSASGQQLFLGTHATLQALGVRTVEIVASDNGVTLVEDLVGGSLEQLIGTDPARGREGVARLQDILAVMHAATSDGVGKVGAPICDPLPCELIAYDRACRHLAEARLRRPEIPVALLDVLKDALAHVEPRTAGHALIHGELGPDHVFLDRHGAPVLIDIEGLMYFDVEWKHAFMAFRFGSMYELLRPAELDPARLRLYTLCLRLSLIAGPLRLLEGNFPHRAVMLAIADANLKAAVAFLP